MWFTLISLTLARVLDARVFHTCWRVSLYLFHRHYADKKKDLNKCLFLIFFAPGLGYIDQDMILTLDSFGFFTF